jgi:hypothetical protein
MRTKHLLIAPGMALALMLICLLTLQLFTAQPNVQAAPCTGPACLAPAEVEANWGYPPAQIGATDVDNGDFESDPNVDWTEYSAQEYYPLVVSSTNLPAGVTPHSGNYAVWLGGDDNETAFISQTVAITTGESTLSYWQWIDSGDLCGYDFGSVLINGSEVYSISLCSNTSTYGWVYRTLNLSAYIGQDVDRQFRVETDGSLTSNLFIDDVSLGQGHYVYLPCLAKNDCGFHFYDDFSNPNSGWWVGDYGDMVFQYLGGEYQIFLRDSEWSAFGTPDLVLPANYRLQVDAHQTADQPSAYGILFGIRWGTNGNYEAYQFLVEPQTQRYLLDERSMNGSWNAIIPWRDASWAINSGTGTNRLRVERIGPAIYLYINDAAVANAYDSSFTSPGRDAGAYIDRYELAPLDVRFDNFRADCVP